jgi:GntR family transcriptional regulator / MocR family aminotransferase
MSSVIGNRLRHPLFKLDHTSATPAYRQIYDRFSSAILSGNYAAGACIPSIRTLAAELKVSRNTVEMAYDLLFGDGLIVRQERTRARVAAIEHNVREVARSLKQSIFDNRDAQKARNGIHPFHPAIPARDALPTKAWYRLNRRAILDRGIFASEPFGYQPLRDSIAAHFTTARGLCCTGDNIFITNGFRQSLMYLASPTESESRSLGHLRIIYGGESH